MTNHNSPATLPLPADHVGRDRDGNSVQLDDLIVDGDNLDEFRVVGHDNTGGIYARGTHNQIRHYSSAELTFDYDSVTLCRMFYVG